MSFWDGLQPGTDRETERELLARAKAGDKAAADRIILTHRPLVAGVLRKLGVARFNQSYDDLAHEGLEGLLTALARWDPAHDVRFATYARWGVRYYIGRARGAMHGVTRSKTRTLRRVRQCLRKHAERLRQMLEREPTAEEIAASIGEGCTAEDVETVQTERLYPPIPVEHSDPYAEDRPGPGYTHTYTPPVLETPEGIVGEVEVHARYAELLQSALAILSERERFILHHRFIERVPFRELGARLHISGERVRQIESDILRKLRELFAEREDEVRNLLEVA